MDTSSNLRSAARISRRDSHLIKRCAARNGISERAARQWRKSESPKWSEFLRLEAAEHVAKQGEFTEPAIPLTARAEADGAARRLAAIAEITDSATRRGDFGSLQSLLRCANEASRVLATARAAASEEAIREREMVPIAILRDGIGPGLRSIANIAKNLPHEVCLRLDMIPHDQAFAVLTDWLIDRYQPAIEEALVAIAKMGPPCQQGPDAGQQGGK